MASFLLGATALIDEMCPSVYATFLVCFRISSEHTKVRASCPCWDRQTLMQSLASCVSVSCLFRAERD